MRELVYLSDAKLEQFLPSLRAMRRWPKITVKAPVLDVGWEQSPDGHRDRLRHFTHVVAQVEKKARWFADPDVEAGDWVQFAAPMNYLVLDRSEFANLVLFVDRRSPNASYPTGGGLRVVLHGSRRHLLLAQPPITLATPEGETVMSAVPSGSGPEAVTADSIDLLLRALESRSGPPEEVRRPLSGPVSQHLPAAVARLAHAVDSRVHPETAAWMAGYARVTAALTHRQGHPGDRVRHLVASPLYVEYAPPRSVDR